MSARLHIMLQRFLNFVFGPVEPSQSQTPASREADLKAQEVVAMTIWMF